MIERRILDLVDAQDGVERTTLALMRNFKLIDVVRNPTRLLGNGKNLILGDVDEFCIGIDETSDQPGTGDTVDLRVFACHPFARSSADVAACRQSLLSPIGNATFQKVCLDSREAECSGHALANF